MSRSKHLQIYQDAYHFTREVFRIKFKLPKLIKYDLGEQVGNSALRILKGIIIANGSKNKLSSLQIVTLEIEVMWVYLRMLYDLEGISRGEFNVLSEKLVEISKQNNNWRSWAKKVASEGVKV